MDDEAAERVYREGMALGTTLQVPAEMWPADRAAFDGYWEESLAKVHIDDAVREYLYPIAVGRMRGAKLPRPLQRWPESFALLITTGFLPQRFRDEMRLPWDPKTSNGSFDRLMAVLRTVNNLLPRFVREFPFNVLLKDLDWRIRTGRPLVLRRRHPVDVDFLRQDLELLRAKAFECETGAGGKVMQCAGTQNFGGTRHCAHPGTGVHC